MKSNLLYLPLSPLAHQRALCLTDEKLAFLESELSRAIDRESRLTNPTLRRWAAEIVLAVQELKVRALRERERLIAGIDGETREVNRGR